MIKKFFAVLLVAIMMTTTSVLAEETATRIQYNMAVRGAINNLPALTGMDDLIRDIDEMRTSLRNWRNHIERTGHGTLVEIAELDRQIGDLGAQINTMRITQEILRTSTEFAMRNSMVSIANTELDIKLLEANLAHERISLENTRLRLAAGLVSESDFNVAELALQQREAELAARQVSLTTERQNLNRILQRSITGDYYIVVNKELMELPADLNAHVRRYAPRQPNVRQRDITVGRARSALSAVFTDFGTPERAERERAYNQAQRERTETLRATETAIRNQYNNMRALMHQNQSLEIDLLRANERLEVARLNHAAGMATPFDILTAELAITRIEISLQRNFNNYWNMQFAFQNPFLLAI